jgi:hypothetical protein
VSLPPPPVIPLHVAPVLLPISPPVVRVGLSPCSHLRAPFLAAPGMPFPPVPQLFALPCPPALFPRTGFLLRRVRMKPTTTIPASLLRHGLFLAHTTEDSPNAFATTFRRCCIQERNAALRRSRCWLPFPPAD